MNASDILNAKIELASDDELVIVLFIVDKRLSDCVDMRHYRALVKLKNRVKNHLRKRNLK